MNIQKIILVIVLSVFATGSALSQKKIGIFVHGFNGTSEKWLEESKVPQNWKNDGIIDDFVALDYKTEELSTEQSQLILLNKFIERMDDLLGDKFDDKSVTLKNRANNDWIIVGHSLGGIVGRLLYPRLRQAGFNIVAVTSIGGPSQGTAAVDVDTMDIKRQINRIKTNFTTATEYEWPLLTYFLNFQDLFNHIGGLLGFSSGPSNREQLQMLPDYLDVARDSAVGYATRVLTTGANNKIGLEGSLIKEINGYNKDNVSLHPKNYLSIIGAEKDQAPIRMIGYIFDDEELKDEVSNLKDLEDFENDYMRRNQRHWNRVADRYAICAVLSKSCRRSRDTARRKEGYWSTARRELHDLGKTWSTIINSYRMITVEIMQYILPCENGVGPIGVAVRLDIGILPNGEECSTNQSGEYVYRPTSIQVADKNDGVVNIHSVLWSEGDGFNDDYNQYFDDVPADGGYNHFELRNYKRAYTLPGEFKKGDLNPPMDEVQKWIKNGFRF